jgi:hypothetical protein
MFCKLGLINIVLCSTIVNIPQLIWLDLIRSLSDSFLFDFKNKIQWTKTELVFLHICMYYAKSFVSMILKEI